MVKYVLFRLSSLIIISWLTVSSVFLLMAAAPGDPAVAVLGERASHEALRQFRARFDLDQSLGRRFVVYQQRLLRGDLGVSYINNEPVSRRLAANLPETLTLTTAGLLTGLAVSFILGLISAYGARPAPVWAVAFYTALAASIPGFFVAYALLALFSLGFHILYGSGAAARHVFHFWAPVLSIGFSLSGLLTRIIGAALTEALKRPSTLLARSLGMRETTIFFRHVCKNMLIPVLSCAGIQWGALLSGAVVCETVFSRAGLGSLLVEAARSRDYPVIQGVALVSVFLYAAVVVASDITIYALTPGSRRELPTR